MSGFDDLSDDIIEAILDGRSDHPSPALTEFVSTMRALAHEEELDEPTLIAHVALVAEAARLAPGAETPVPPRSRRPRMLRSLSTLGGKIATGIIAFTLFGSTAAALAATGTLPPPVQRTVAGVADHVGLDLPSPDDPAPAPATAAAPTSTVAPTTSVAPSTTVTSLPDEPASPSEDEVAPVEPIACSDSSGDGAGVVEASDGDGTPTVAPEDAPDCDSPEGDHASNDTEGDHCTDPSADTTGDLLADATSGADGTILDASGDAEECDQPEATQDEQGDQGDQPEATQDEQGDQGDQPEATQDEQGDQGDQPEATQDEQGDQGDQGGDAAHDGSDEADATDGSDSSSDSGSGEGDQSDG